MTETGAQPPPAEDAAAPPAPVKTSLLGAARKRFETLAGLVARGPGAAADGEVVHDLRVGSRRLGEVVRLLARFMDKPTAKAVAASVRALRRAMGDLRDSDVTRAHLLKWKLPAALHKVAGEIAGSLEAGRAELQTAAQAQIQSASLQGSLVILARVLEDRAAPVAAAETEAELAQTLLDLIRRRDKALRKSFGRAAKKQTAASLHEARIEVKKLRYLLELAADGGTLRGAKKKIAFLKQIQQLLGDHHDTHVIAEQLAAHVRDRREKPITGLAPAWRKWLRQANTLQSKRAAAFFARTYAWINT